VCGLEKSVRLESQRPKIMIKVYSVVVGLGDEDRVVSLSKQGMI
jgi:hypothetical protein